jgi:hypothetical protein
MPISREVRFVYDREPRFLQELEFALFPPRSPPAAFKTGSRERMIW